MKECMSLSLCNLSLHSLWGVRDTVERERRGRDAKLREKREDCVFRPFFGSFH